MFKYRLPVSAKIKLSGVCVWVSRKKTPVSYSLSMAFMFCFSWGPQSSLLAQGEERKESHISATHVLALVCQVRSKCSERQRKADAGSVSRADSAFPRVLCEICFSAGLLLLLLPSEKQLRSVRLEATTWLMISNLLGHLLLCCISWVFKLIMSCLSCTQYLVSLLGAYSNIWCQASSFNFQSNFISGLLRPFSSASTDFSVMWLLSLYAECSWCSYM